MNQVYVMKRRMSHGMFNVPEGDDRHVHTWDFAKDKSAEVGKVAAGHLSCPEGPR